MRCGRRLGLYVVLIGICVVALFPVYWMVATSFLPKHDIFRYPPTFLPWPPSYRGYQELLTGTQLATWILNSLAVVSVSTVASVGISLLAAYSMSRFASSLGVATGYLLLATRMVPPSLLVIPLYLMFRRVGLLDTHVALILAYTTFEIPFATWMLKGYLDSIPKELDEAAQVDGCSRLGAIFRVIVPVSWPGVVASVIASIILGWSDYLFALTFINNPSRWTVTVGIGSFFGEHEILWTHIMGSAVLSILPIVLLFLMLGRGLVGGLTAGAVKS